MNETLVPLDLSDAIAMIERQGEKIAALTKDKYRGPNCAECSMHGNYDL